MEEEAGIYARHEGYLDRYVQFGTAQGRLISLTFPNTPEQDHDTDHELLDRIDAYLEGSEEEFGDVSVALTVPTDQRKVLEQVREIPYGEEVSCAQLARMTPGIDSDDDDAAGAIRTALVENPVPVVIPDHRVRDGPSAAPASVEQKLRAVEGL